MAFPHCTALTFHIAILTCELIVLKENNLNFVFFAVAMTIAKQPIIGNCH